MQNDKDLELTRGSRYSVAFDKKEVVGVFKGYSVIGSENALVIDSEGKIQFIMINHINSITLLESVANEIKKKEGPGVYYG